MNINMQMTVVRELEALGEYYRNDWSSFDGRTLRDELDNLAIFIVRGEGDFTEFSELLAEQKDSY